MWFGYLNRNYDETPNIVIGGNNTFFAADGVDSAGLLIRVCFWPIRARRTEVSPLTYPRRQQFVFGVVYPLILLVKSWYGRLVTMVKRAPR